MSDYFTYINGEKVSLSEEAAEVLQANGSVVYSTTNSQYLMETKEVRTTSVTGGQKGVKLERYDLIPVRPLEALARHYGVGARKYEERNWEKGYDWSKSYAALQRHANAFWGGEDIDEETQAPHLAGVLFHAMALLEFMTTHAEYDDRPNVEMDPQVAALLKKMV